MRAMALTILLILGPVSREVGAEMTVRWGEPGDPVHDRIMTGSRLWLESVCAPRPELANYLSEHFLATGIDGTRYQRRRVLEASDFADLCQLQRVRVRIFGHRMAVAYGNEAVTRIEDGEARRRCVAWTDTWLNEADGWRIVAAQDNYVVCGDSGPAVTEP